MLERLGYDPHGYPPNYGEADKFVAENTQLIKRNEDYWRRRSQEIISMSKIGRNSNNNNNVNRTAAVAAAGANGTGGGAGGNAANPNPNANGNTNNNAANPAPADGYKYIQKDTDSVDGAGKADGATANEDHKDIEGDHKDIQDTR